MVAAAPEVYRDYVTVDRQGRKVELKKALYGLIKSVCYFTESYGETSRARGLRSTHTTHVWPTKKTTATR